MFTAITEQRQKKNLLGNLTGWINMRSKNGVLSINSAEFHVVCGEFHLKCLNASANTKKLKLHFLFLVRACYIFTAFQHSHKEIKSTVLLHSISGVLDLYLFSLLRNKEIIKCTYLESTQWSDQTIRTWPLVILMKRNPFTWSKVKHSWESFSVGCVSLTSRLWVTFRTYCLHTCVVTGIGTETCSTVQSDKQGHKTGFNWCGR